MIKKVIMVVTFTTILLWIGFMAERLPPALAPRSLNSNIQAETIPVTGVKDFEGCPGTIIAPIGPEVEQTVVELTNQLRATQGLPPLKRVERLDDSARYHAADMNYDDYFDHNTFDRGERGLVASCNTWERMENYYPFWNAMGENIAAGQNTPEAAMDGWINSPDHLHNLLSDSYWEIGVGYFEGEGSFHYYWDQNFGRRQGSYPLIINQEAAQTSSPTVDIYIYGTWGEMSLRIDQGEWSEWTSFQREFSLPLPAVSGQHTVAVMLRKPGSSAESSDSIELVKKQASVLDSFFSPLAGLK